MCHEDVAFDLRHIDGFLLVSEYAGKAGVVAGEFGADKNGIRFCSSSQGYVLAGASGTTAAGTNVQNTSSYVDVYSVFVVGRDALGGVNLAGANGGIVRKSLTSGGTSDPLEMRSTVGWKKYDARAVLNQAFMQEIQVCASS